MDKEIEKHRVNLRNIYKKYQTELHEAVTKIDKFLETLQNKNEE